MLDARWVLITQSQSTCKYFNSTKLRTNCVHGMRVTVPNPSLCKHKHFAATSLRQNFSVTPSDTPPVGFEVFRQVGNTNPTKKPGLFCALLCTSSCVSGAHWYYFIIIKLNSNC